MYKRSKTKDMYAENFKLLIKKIKANLNNWRTYCVHRLGDST